MSNTIRYILVALGCLILIGAGVELGYLFWHQKPIATTTTGDYYKQQGFKTDTVKFGGITIDTIYLPKKAYPIPLPPKQVIIYKDYRLPLQTTTLKDSTTRAWLDTTQYRGFLFDTTNYKGLINKYPQTLVKYSGYDRLIYGEIGKDTIRLDLQKDDNTPYTVVYLSDFSKYKYQISNNSMRISELKTSSLLNVAPNTNLFRYNGTYIFSGYQRSDKTVQIGAESGINIGKIRTTGYISLPINLGTVSPNYGIKVGYKLF